MTTAICMRTFVPSSSTIGRSVGRSAARSLAWLIARLPAWPVGWLAVWPAGLKTFHDKREDPVAFWRGVTQSEFTAVACAIMVVLHPLPIFSSGCSGLPQRLSLCLPALLLIAWLAWWIASSSLQVILCDCSFFPLSYFLFSFLFTFHSPSPLCPLSSFHISSSFSILPFFFVSSTLSLTSSSFSLGSYSIIFSSSFFFLFPHFFFLLLSSSFFFFPLFLLSSPFLIGPLFSPRSRLLRAHASIRAPCTAATPVHNCCRH